MALFRVLTIYANIITNEIGLVFFFSFFENKIKQILFNTESRDEVFLYLFF